MRSTRLFRTARQQAGSTLLEGIIAVLLLAIVGMGITFTLSRVALAQTTLNAQNSVISQLRSGLQSISVSNSFASATAASTTCNINMASTMLLGAQASVTNQTSCTLNTVSISIGGGSVTGSGRLPQISNAVNDSKLGGTLTVNN
ncbi:PulJ/GspJ family protein [Silvimonas iriomotensis]|uniref:Uncharacterized protein n=1 Tax=Silvimonas iriomotensis TaxID=449662 RepID=A0ABQ2P942_9NEIS|nr:hypothetical protein [Silvimonas iriomotensis]GGP21080.1 hypothetical protein GCM10010970_18610 [Silvimonas iriomotensis]